MHSGLILFFCLIGIVSVQFLAVPWLGIAVACYALLGLCLAPARLWRMARRIRFLLAAIFILFAWFTPGEAVFASWSVLSPSKEGLALALIHSGRLLAVVCIVAALLERLSADRLVSGLYALCRPLAVIGIAVDRLALRLLLVLRYVDDAAVEHKQDWRYWLTGDESVADAPLHLRLEPFGWQERVLAMAALGALGVYVALCATGCLPP